MYKEKLGDIANDLKRFRDMTEKFYAKEISVKEYKGFSGFFGSYAQRGGQSSMLRLRLSCGQLTKEKLKFIVDSVEQYQVKRGHLTTCQTIQLHDLQPNAVYEIMKGAIEHDIITLGGGGDFPRNVTCSPLSGVEDEYFDVLPYAKLTGDYLLSILREIKLPRKLKVAFSNSEKNSSHATIRDLGFVARENGTFDVYSGGGMGANAKMGLLVAEDVSPDKILYYVRAMADLFVEHGNYENRAKARSRYMQEKLGEQGYIDAYKKNLEACLAKGGLDLKPELTAVTKKGSGPKTSDTVNDAVKEHRVVAQKQQGLYAVYYHPEAGTFPAEKMREIYDVIEPMDQVELRLTPQQGLYIINCTDEEAQQVLAVTADGAKTALEASVACVGVTICQNGIGDSPALLRSIIQMEKECGFVDGILPQIHISGCPSSCGTHQVGRIGFHGGMTKAGDTMKPSFTLHVNGSCIAGKERFGDSLGVILAENIPAFLKEVGKAVEAEAESFDQWFDQDSSRFEAIAKKYVK